MSESVRYFRIDSRDLVYLKFILEAYDGLATMSTADAKNGIIRISTPYSQKDDLDRLLHALGAETSFSEIPAPQPLPTDTVSTVMEHCHA